MWCGVFVSEVEDVDVDRFGADVFFFEDAVVDGESRGYLSGRVWRGFAVSDLIVISDVIFDDRFVVRCLLFCIVCWEIFVVFCRVCSCLSAVFGKLRFRFAFHAFFL